MPRYVVVFATFVALLATVHQLDSMFGRSLKDSNARHSRDTAATAPHAVPKEVKGNRASLKQQPAQAESVDKESTGGKHSKDKRGKGERAKDKRAKGKRAKNAELANRAERDQANLAAHPVLQPLGRAYDPEKDCPQLFKADYRSRGLLHTPMKNTHWWKPYVERLAAPWKKDQRNWQDWCDPQVRETGYWLTKLPKAASSTCAGVTSQIARSCHTFYHHGFKYVGRREPFFFWTVLRQPYMRTISHYYYLLGPREADARKFLCACHGDRHYQLAYVSQLSSGNDTNTRIRDEQPKTHLRYNLSEAREQMVQDLMIQDVLRRYHFIALVERLEESLVVMKRLFGFRYVDLIVLPSKTSGGYDFRNPCRQLPKSNLSQEIFEQGRRIHEESNWDYFLYAVVNRSLDLTVEMLGRATIHNELEKFRTLQEEGEKRCRAEAIFPCDDTVLGKPPRADANCFFQDSGCGHECVQRELAGLGE
mmetsp:Transcript_27441/g.63913  ORF Transcript_27441/g.63913 Transcript_27441/m.63913 type:complete len:478 (+) Transcript_27441:58-1491(+)